LQKYVAPFCLTNENQSSHTQITNIRLLLTIDTSVIQRDIVQFSYGMNDRCSSR